MAGHEVCTGTTEIKALLEVLADAVTLNPPAGGVQLEVEGEFDGSGPVRLRSGDHDVVVDVVPHLGGDDNAPDPVAYALVALGACQMLTYEWWSARLGMRLDRVQVAVAGHFDLRGVLGTDNHVRPGLQRVDVKVELAGPEPPDRYRMLRDVVDRYSPVLDLFTNGVPTTCTLSVEPNRRTEPDGAVT